MKFKILVLFYWLQELLRRGKVSAEELGRLQERRLKHFAARVLSKSPFYSEYFEGDSFAWDKVPQLSRDEFMGNFNTINTAGIKLDEAMDFALESERKGDFSGRLRGVTVGLSTGTSGKRALFLVSERERARWTAMVITRVVKPLLFKKQRVAFFLRANSNLYTSVGSSLFDFQYFNISMPPDELLARLEGFKPAILAAPPSILYDISLARRDGRITINPGQVISFAEVLHDSDRKFIEETFGTMIREVYQCTEGFLGVSCRRGTIHLNEDLVLFEKEWIDDDHFYPVITDFSRVAQPVVKYKMNDILKIKKGGCECGSSYLAIEKIIGRDDDVLLFDGIKIYPDIVARRIALATNDFHRYTVVQVSPGRLEIGIECESADFERVKADTGSAIASLLSEYNIKNVEMVFHNHIKHVAGDKMRKIKRQYNEI